MTPIELAIAAIASYLCGSIPFGVLIAKAKGVDIMSVGSGNPGATNVWRTLGPAAGFTVFLTDTLKGAVPAAIVLWLSKDASFGLVAGILAIIGHTFSPFLKFKGGKGVATAFGALVGSAPIIAGIVFAIFALIVALTRYISLGSIIAVISLVGLGIAFNMPAFVIGAYAVMAVFIVYRHSENIARLKAGTERKFSFKKSKDQS